MDREVLLLLTGVGIALASSLITLAAQHVLSLRRDAISRGRERAQNEADRQGAVEAFERLNRRAYQQLRGAGERVAHEGEFRKTLQRHTSRHPAAPESVDPDASSNPEPGESM
jgi:hypothetical protein